MRIFSSVFESEIRSADEIVDHLESGDCPDQERQEIVSMFERDHRTRHANTFLLQALAWNRLVAADKLLDLDVEKVALNTKDFWPTGANTPLLLAAKIGANTIIQKLVMLGASVDEQDYRGLTALHYACMLRLDSAIEILLNAEADTQLLDSFGNRPVDYYHMDISFDDLAYPYGLNPENNNLLADVVDTSENYFATQNRCLSAIRWFVPHIIVNQQWGKNIVLNAENNPASMSVFEWAEWHLQNRRAVYHAHVYEAMLTCFCQSRSPRHIEFIE